MQTAKINVTQILKEHLFKGAKGTYLDIAIFENKDGEDEFGNHGFITQSLSKEARLRGERGPIIGNWRHIEAKPKPAAPVSAPPASPIDDDDLPF